MKALYELSQEDVNFINQIKLERLFFANKFMANFLNRLIMRLREKYKKVD